VIREQRGKTRGVIPMEVRDEHRAKAAYLQSCKLRARFHDTPLDAGPRVEQIKHPTGDDADTRARPIYVEVR